MNLNTTDSYGLNRDLTSFEHWIIRSEISYMQENVKYATTDWERSFIENMYKKLYGVHIYLKPKAFLSNKVIKMIYKLSLELRCRKARMEGALYFYAK